MSKYESYGVPDLGFKALIGKRVETIDINPDRDLLRFSLAGGEVIYASAVGGCCSRSWFESIEGVDALIGHEVLRVTDRAMPPENDKTGDPEYGSLIQFYGWTIETSRGRFDIEMRNESNGYYGGEVIVSDVASDQYRTERDYEYASDFRQLQPWESK